MINKLSCVDEKAIIAKNVKIGPFSFIGKNVNIAKNCYIHNHVSITGNTTIGENTEIFPFASIGSSPQDLKYRGESSFLVIGNNNTFRENVTVNTGTEGGGLFTRIQDNCLFMVGSHIAHDCIIGSNVILANNATLAGHVACLTIPDQDASLSATAMSDAAKKLGMTASPAKTLAAAFDQLDQNAPVIICGSLYLAGHILWQNKTLPA